MAVANNATPEGATTGNVPQPYAQTGTSSSEFKPAQGDNAGMNTGTSVAVSKQPTPEEKNKGKDGDKPAQRLPQGSLDPQAMGLFDPAMFLEPHDEVPMALVNRKPHGSESW